MILKISRASPRLHQCDSFLSTRPAQFLRHTDDEPLLLFYLFFFLFFSTLPSSLSPFISGVFLFTPSVFHSSNSLLHSLFPYNNTSPVDPGSSFPSALLPYHYIPFNSALASLYLYLLKTCFLVCSVFSLFWFRNRELLAGYHPPILPILYSAGSRYSRFPIPSSFPSRLVPPASRHSATDTVAVSIENILMVIC